MSEEKTYWITGWIPLFDILGREYMWVQRDFQIDLTQQFEEGGGLYGEIHRQ